MRNFWILLTAMLLVSAGPAWSVGINTSGRCPPNQSCEIGQGVAGDITLDTDGADLTVSSTNLATLSATTTASPTFIGADAAGAADTIFDTTDAGTVQMGSADVTAMTMVTDGAALNLEGTTANTLTLTAATTGTMTIAGADAAGAANTTLDTATTGTITIGSADVGEIVLSSDEDVQIHGGVTGNVTLDFRDYADTTDDDMAHSIISTNCTTATTGAEECDMNISITTGGANIEIVAIDPAGGVEIGDATTTAHTFTSDGLNGTVVIDGSVLAQVPAASVASGALAINGITLATASADFDIPDGACATAADIGNWVTVVLEDASTVISITSDDASNIITVPGLGLGAGDELDSVSVAAHEGLNITLTCLTADNWYMTAGVLMAFDTDPRILAWADGGGAD